MDLNDRFLLFFFNLFIIIFLFSGQSSAQQDPFDDREPLVRDRPENPEWRDDRRDMRDDRVVQDRQSEIRREAAPREERIERSERPQRPDSRDSRASRESRTSLRDDEMHKSRDCGSWINDIPDYEEKKREIMYREDNRDRRQPPGPVTREKIEADELKGEKRSSLTQLKRSLSELDRDVRKDGNKESPTEPKKEAEVWNRKQEGRPVERGDNSPKAWADAVSPTFELEDDKVSLEPIKDDRKEIEDMKQGMEKLGLADNKREDAMMGGGVEPKEDAKDEKRDKNVRNRTNSGSSRGRESGRSARQWGGYSVYTRGWRGSDQRGRRGGPRSLGRPGSARSGSYGHTDSEQSGDEISGSTESGKEERRPARSPKPSQKLEKDDRNREVSRRDDKRAGDYPQVRSEKRGYEGRPSREGFAPSGEPSRRGRGGFRNRGPTTGGRMNTNYGPPPSKSPFSTERSADDKESGQQKPSTPTPEGEILAPVGGGQISESTDDKIIAKQQALTAGITGGRHAKSPNQQGNNKQDSIQGQNPAPPRSQGRKDEGRIKRNHSSSRRMQVSRESPSEFVQRLCKLGLEN